MRLLIFAALLFMKPASALELIRLHPGFITKLRCDGKLLISSVGNEAIVLLSALPKELGCGVFLRPISASGKTNLFLETSSGTISRLIEIDSGGRSPNAGELEYRLKGDAQ